jgi:hypothetical protein
VNRKVSASKVKKYLQCPRSFEDSYLRGNWAPPSQPATQGSIAHEAIARGYEFKKEHGKEMDVRDKLNHIDVLFKEDFKNGNTNYRDSMEDLIRETRELVLIHHEDIAVRVNPFLIEKPFSVMVEDVELVGIWDVIDESGWVIDNKFFSKSPSQSELDRDIQMSFYSLAYRLMFNEVERGIRLDCVIKTKNKKSLQLTTNRTSEELQWTAKLITQVADAMESGNHVPNPTTWLCDPRFCGAYEACQHGGYQ